MEEERVEEVEEEEEEATASAFPLFCFLFFWARVVLPLFLGGIMDKILNFCVSRMCFGVSLKRAQKKPSKEYTEKKETRRQRRRGKCCESDWKGESQRGGIPTKQRGLVHT